MLRATNMLLRGRRPTGSMLGTIRSQRSWDLPDVRQANKNQSSVNRLESIMFATQHHGEDGGGAVDYRNGHPIRGQDGGFTYQADAQSALLSRPGGRRSRMDSSSAGTFHYKKAQKPPKFNSGKFRKYYNSS